MKHDFNLIKERDTESLYILGDLPIQLFPSLIIINCTFHLPKRPQNQGKKESCLVVRGIVGMNGKCGVKKIRERMLLHTYISLSFPCVLFNCNEIKRAFPYLYFISIKHYTQGLGVHHQTRFFLLSSYTPTF